MTVKKTKTVAEAFGGSEATSKNLEGLTELEILEIGEIITAIIASVTSEIVQMSESDAVVVKPDKLEGAKLLEFYDIYSELSMSVDEILGLVESYLTSIKVDKSEQLGLFEFYTIAAITAVNVLESLYFGESYNQATKAVRSEVAEIAESYLTKSLIALLEGGALSEDTIAKPRPIVLEGLGLGEEYGKILGRAGEDSEFVRFNEIIGPAVRTRGNVEKTFNFGTLLDWEDVTTTTTEWIKTKTKFKES
jgi:hypothetical protein